jgi:hypothetical protein
VTGADGAVVAADVDVAGFVDVLDVVLVDDVGSSVRAPVTSSWPRHALTDASATSDRTAITGRRESIEVMSSSCPRDVIDP